MSERTFSELPHCATCGKLIKPYRIFCPLEDGKVACARCANELDFWSIYDQKRKRRR